MNRIASTTRIALSLGMWSAVVLLCLQLIGVLNDGSQQAITQRTRLCEAVAVSCSQLASLQQFDEIQVALETLAARNPEVRSAACRRPDGSLAVAVGRHDTVWQSSNGGRSPWTQIAVDVYDGAKVWGTVEVAFDPPYGRGWTGWFVHPGFRVTSMAAALNFCGFAWILRRSLQRIDPASAVPGRVRTALNTMSELVLVLDEKRRIMLANEAFARRFGSPASDFQGQSLDSLPWHSEDEEDSIAARLDALLSPDARDSAVATEAMRLRIQGELFTFKPNASKITDEDGKPRGTLLSLDDITVLAKRTAELQVTMQELRTSRAEIEEQNEQLRFLATRDPLTSCYNRRAFFEFFELSWKSVRRYDHPLSCLMVDIDHFKSINDRHGHAMGDEVLKRVSATLLKLVRETDTVGRLGGEEFCILLPHVDLEGARQAAERFRSAIASLEFAQLTVTVSIGCSATSLQAESIEELMEQSDQALYAAKHGGRNRVMIYAATPAAESTTSDDDWHASAHTPAAVADVS